MSVNAINGTTGTANLSKNAEWAKNGSENAASNTQIHDEAIKGIRSMEELRQASLRGLDVTVSDEQLIRALEKAAKAVQLAMVSLDFSIHEQTKRIMVKVRDKETGEIIREIPPEKTQDLLVKLWEMAGILIDERL
jgi:flagellar protein FlaG